MSIAHCPLCLALAVLSVVRGLSHAVLLRQLLPGGLRPRRASQDSPAAPALPGALLMILQLS